MSEHIESGKNINLSFVRIDLATLSSAVLMHVVSRDSFSRSWPVHETDSVLFYQEQRNLWYCFISDFSMPFCITFKKKTLANDSYLGHIQITLSVDQVDQQV